MRKGLAPLLLLAVACTGATASFAQTGGGPGTGIGPSGTADVWIQGEGNTLCAEVSRVVAEERNTLPVIHAGQP